MSIESATISSHRHDELRLEALRRYNILDTAPEKEFDDIVRLVGHICQCPIAVINFIDKSRQWFKSEIGLGVRETALDISICVQALVEPDLFIVGDTHDDPRFRDNPLVTGNPHLRFYAGALLQTPKGQKIGTLCVLDYVPRQLTEGQKEALRTLSRQVMAQLELRRALAAAAQNEAALLKAKEDAEAANRAKDRHLAFLSHELRTPLTPALLTAGAMAADMTLPAETRADAATIARNIEMATCLTDDLLDVNRIALGKLELRLQVADVHATIMNSLAMCESDAAAKNVRVVHDLQAQSHWVRGDVSKLQQVWSNLIKNAVKFTPPHGTVKVQTSNPTAAGLQIEVSDTGQGIEASLLPRIFNLYEQGDRSVTREHSGLGLGLAICKGIVAAHGGTIAAASAGKGHGATMTVNLAIVTSPAAAKPVKRSPDLSSTDAAALRILLVDDHDDTLRAMSRLLTRNKHRVTTASCVSSALSAAADGEFDLLISDVGLPDGTGLDLMRQLLQTRPIKGIALTGYGTESDVQQTRAAGFVAHLVKPIDFKQLEAVIRETSATP